MQMQMHHSSRMDLFPAPSLAVASVGFLWPMLPRPVTARISGTANPTVQTFTPNTGRSVSSRETRRGSDFIKQNTHLVALTSDSLEISTRVPHMSDLPHLKLLRFPAMVRNKGRESQDMLNCLVAGCVASTLLI